MRALMLFLLLLPFAAYAQEPGVTERSPTTAATLALLKAQRPKEIPEDQWLQMMERPVNRSLYPIRITQAMLDTLDATLLDRRYQYVMVRE